MAYGCSTRSRSSHRRIAVPAVSSYHGLSGSTCGMAAPHDRATLARSAFWSQPALSASAHSARAAPRSAWICAPSARRTCSSRWAISLACALRRWTSTCAPVTEDEATWIALCSPRLMASWNGSGCTCGSMAMGSLPSAGRVLGLIGRRPRRSRVRRREVEKRCLNGLARCRLADWAPGLARPGRRLVRGGRGSRIGWRARQHEERLSCSIELREEGWILHRSRRRARLGVSEDDRLRGRVFWRLNSLFGPGLDRTEGDPPGVICRVDGVDRVRLGGLEAIKAGWLLDQPGNPLAVSALRRCRVADGL